ncbi:unnamed protein product [Taenia asiatica]|uniref:GST N-terminal domain-containing protein n=1 Tax=Taenia asiatica TaxID=60517 RepID=A0A3P6QDF6_TAEAS|nr:unnamed protein product [Taenia asiatica]
MKYLGVEFDYKPYKFDPGKHKYLMAQPCHTAANFDRDDWLSKKFPLSLDFSSAGRLFLPYYIDDDFKLIQSVAILGNIAEWHGRSELVYFVVLCRVFSSNIVELVTLIVRCVCVAVPDFKSNVLCCTCFNARLYQNLLQSRLCKFFFVVECREIAMQCCSELRSSLTFMLITGEVEATFLGNKDWLTSDKKLQLGRLLWPLFIMGKFIDATVACVESGLLEYGIVRIDKECHCRYCSVLCLSLLDRGSLKTLSACIDTITKQTIESGCQHGHVNERVCVECCFVWFCFPSFNPSLPSFLPPSPHRVPRDGLDRPSPGQVRDLHPHVQGVHPSSVESRLLSPLAAFAPVSGWDNQGGIQSNWIHYASIAADVAASIEDVELHKCQ